MYYLFLLNFRVYKEFYDSLYIELCYYFIIKNYATYSIIYMVLNFIQ